MSITGKTISVDTETTGLRRHDYPFMVTYCKDNGKFGYFEWPVLKGRKVLPPKKDLVAVQKLIDTHKNIVFHNALFDVGMLSKIGINVPWEKVHDTSIMSHMFNNITHSKLFGKLKPLALNYCDIDDRDEKILRQSVSRCRQMVKNTDRYPQLKHLLPLIKDDDFEDELACDFWLPSVVGRIMQNDQLTEVCQQYACTDAVRTMELFHYFKSKVETEHFELYQRERKLLRVTGSMQSLGVNVIKSQLTGELKRFQNEAALLTNIVESATQDLTNINSNEQVGNVLFSHLGIQPHKATKTGYSLDKESVKAMLTNTKSEKQIELEHQIDDLFHDSRVKPKAKEKRIRFLQDLLDEAKTYPHLVLESYSRFKVCNTAIKYLESYKRALTDGKIFPSFNQVGTSTTRYSCSNPNTQNISKGKELTEGEKPEYNLRKVFGPEKGRKWFCIDYSQLQLRIFAFVSGDRSMIQAFERGYDFHSFVASTLLRKDIDKITSIERREYGKNVNFGFVFGKKFPPEIERLLTNEFPTAHAYMERVKRDVYQKGFVHTPHGYQLYIPYEGGKIKSHAWVNYIVQGCEGDIVKEAMVNCHEYLEENKRLQTSLIMQVHDELVFDAPNNLKPEAERKMLLNIKRLMEAPSLRIGMTTPVDISFTKSNWAETSHYDLVS
jgi:DNA polymerase I-like protein with 3'-5' exonuclease and polymerase domains